MNHEVMDRLDACLNDAETPAWGRVLLIILRDNHRELYRHLAWHETNARRVVGIVTPVSAAVIIAVVWALIELL